VNKILTIAKLAILSVLRKKDIYVLFVISIAILVGICSMNVMGLAGIAAYIKDIGLLFTWLFSIIMTTSIAGSTLQDEEKSGTIYSLLAKPINRKQLMLGKWLGIFTISVAATFVFYFIVIVLVLLKGGSFEVYSLIQTMILHFGVMSIIISYSLFFSARLNSDAATIISYVMTAICFLIIPKIPQLIASPASTKVSSFIFTVMYNVFPHFEILDLRQRIVHGFDAIPVGVFAITVLYSIFFTTIFLIFAWLAYRNKYFSRSGRY
jgi:ABC-type transport system involved in multi-copper enzyme maturation permease subunit